MVREDQRMPLRQHLEELRRTLIRCAIVFVVLIALGVFIDHHLLEFVNEPWRKTREALSPPNGPRDPGALTYIGPGEAMLSALKVSFLFSVFIGAPYFLWELWRFIGVGLLPKERAAVARGFLPGVFLFLGGLWFGFQVLLPLGLAAMVNYVSPDIAVSNVTLGNYLSFVTVMTLVMGLVFELPLVMWAIVRAGLVTRATLARSRRLMVLGGAVFAAVITPSTDAWSMLLVLGPMLILYEVGLVLCLAAEKARERAAQGLD
jgi:sec-independent protein translocase protein TatC